MARFEFHESKTASIAPRSCSCTSCGNLWPTLADDRLEPVDQRLPGGRIDFGIGRDAERFLHRLNLLFEMFFADSEHDVGEHHDEAAIGIPSEAFVAGQLRETLDGPVREPQIEDRVHHAGHRDARAAADRNEQRVLDGAEAFAGTHLEFAHREIYLVLQALGEGAAGVVKAQARLGRDREPRRDRQTGSGHLRETGALPAEDVLQGVWLGRVAHRFAFFKEVDVLGPGLGRHRSNFSLR